MADTPLIDVRAPVEFLQGALPGAVNLPIMNDQERAIVGTLYKQQGRDAAVARGHDLVSGEIREARLAQWADFIRRHPEAVIYCFRGGLRSQITQRWLAEAGLARPLLAGGYKVARHFLREQIDQFAAAHSLLILSGPTGSAKTRLLWQAQKFSPVVDLEGLAQHRGSAFGGATDLQPTQVNFENTLAVRLLKLSVGRTAQKVLVEDESRLIGRCAIPESFFARMRASEVLFIEEPFECRVENIFKDYIVETSIGKGGLAKGLAQFASYQKSLLQISSKLGGLRTQEILQDLMASQHCFLQNPRDLESNKIWIGKLLSYYYDPMYAKSLAKRDPKIIFRGNTAATLEYVRSQFQSQEN